LLGIRRNLGLYSGEGSQTDEDQNQKRHQYDGYKQREAFFTLPGRTGSAR
jgi:hypothetical protein